MLKKDFLLAQLQQLGRILAKVKGLILEDEEPKALEEIRSALSHYYGLTTDQQLIDLPVSTFIDQLRGQDFKAEEWDMLAAFLDELAGLYEEEDVRKALWLKVLAIYDLLENDFRFLSFDNMARKQLLLRATSKD